MKAQEESHKHEMKVIQDRLHLEMEEKVKKLKKMHLVLVAIRDFNVHIFLWGRICRTCLVGNSFG